jgi:hypothetical protein
MPALPAILAIEPEDTTVVGDIEAFIEYVENGQALQDWYERMAAMTAECEAFLTEHGHIWNHIVIQNNQAA